MKNEIKCAMHKTPHQYSYHAESYSVQARKMSDEIMDNVNCGAWCIEQAFRFFALSYRSVLIRDRARNRFRRYLKKGKVHENSESVQRWQAYKEERDLEFYENLVGHYMDY